MSKSTDSGLQSGDNTRTGRHSAGPPGGGSSQLDSHLARQLASGLISGQKASAAAAGAGSSRIPLPVGRPGPQLPSDGGAVGGRRSSDSDDQPASHPGSPSRLSRRRLPPGFKSSTDELSAVASDGESGLGDTLFGTSTEQLEALSPGVTLRLGQLPLDSARSSPAAGIRSASASSPRKPPASAAEGGDGAEAAVVAVNLPDKSSLNAIKQLLHNLSPTASTAATSADSVVEARRNVERAILEADRHLQASMAAENSPASRLTTANNNNSSLQRSNDRRVPVEVIGRSSEAPAATRSGNNVEKEIPITRQRSNFDTVDNEVAYFERTSLPPSVSDIADRRPSRLSNSESDSGSLTSGLTEPDPDSDPVPTQDSATQTPRCRSTQTLESVASQTNVLALHGGLLPSAGDAAVGEGDIVGSADDVYLRENPAIDAVDAVRGRPLQLQQQQRLSPGFSGDYRATPRVDYADNRDISPRFLDNESTYDGTSASMPSLRPGRHLLGEPNNGLPSSNWALGAAGPDRDRPWNDVPLSRLSWPLTAGRYNEDYSTRFFDSEAASLPVQIDRYQVSTQTPVRIRVNGAETGSNPEFAVIGDLPTDGPSGGYVSLPQWAALGEEGGDGLPTQDFSSQTFGQVRDDQAHRHTQTPTVGGQGEGQGRRTASSIQSSEDMTDSTRGGGRAKPDSTAGASATGAAPNSARKGVLKLLLSQVRQLKSMAENAQAAQAAGDNPDGRSSSKKRQRSKPGDKKTRGPSASRKDGGRRPETRGGLPSDAESLASSQAGDGGQQTRGQSQSRGSRSDNRAPRRLGQRKLPEVPASSVTPSQQQTPRVPLADAVWNNRATPGYPAANYYNPQQQPYGPGHGALPSYAPQQPGYGYPPGAQQPNVPNYPQPQMLPQMPVAYPQTAMPGQGQGGPVFTSVIPVLVTPPQQQGGDGGSRGGSSRSRKKRKDDENLARMEQSLSRAERAARDMKRITDHMQDNCG